MTSSSPALTEHGPDAFEKVAYYNGITGDADQPELVYRSDALTAPFAKPSGRFAKLSVKSVRGVFDTPLNKVWDTVGPQICDIIKAHGIQWTSIDPARFFTHGPVDEEEKGCLGPVVIWIGVLPGSTSPNTAHNVSQQILGLLRKNAVEDVVVEWREAVLQTLAGSPLMRHVHSIHPTHHVRRFLTPLLAVPLATESMEEEDSQGTLTLWFHENKDHDGKPSSKVYGVSNCHVLRKDTTVDYVLKRSAKDRVRVCGLHRFQRGLDEIMDAIDENVDLADLWTREIANLQAQDPQNAREIQLSEQQVEEANYAIANLEKLHDEVTKFWSSIKRQRNIGHVVYAPAITVDQGHTEYTSDWGVFLADEAIVKDAFEGNTVDLGSKYSITQFIIMFYPTYRSHPSDGSSATFIEPHGGKLRISGCATREELAAPAEFDSEGQRCLMVGKDGNTTDLTVGRYAGLESFTLNALGVESKELAIYNSGYNVIDAFSAKGDSGSLVWHIKDSQAQIVGQLHSAQNKGGSTSNHISYCTPGWYLLAEIKKKYKYADFYRTEWAA